MLPDEREVRQGHVGETVGAFVVQKEGVYVGKSELLHVCHEHLAPDKWPNDVVLASFLLKNSIGKILNCKFKEDAGALVS